MAVQQSMTAKKAASAADLFPYPGGAFAPPAPKGIPQLDGEPVKIQVSQLSSFVASSGWKSQEAVEVDISMAPLKIPGHDPTTAQPATFGVALQQAALQEQLMFDRARLGTWPQQPPGAFWWAPPGPWAWPNCWPPAQQAPPEYWPSCTTEPPPCGGSPKSTEAGTTSDGESSSPTSGPEDFSLPPPPPPGLPVPISNCGEIAMDIERVLVDSLQTTMHEAGAEDHEASPHKFSYSREEMLAVYGASLPSTPPGLGSFSDVGIAPPPGLSLPESSSAADLVPSAVGDAGISDMSPTTPSELNQTDCWAAWLSDTQPVEEEDQVNVVQMEESVPMTEELSVEEAIVPQVNVVKMEESVPVTEELSVEEAIVPHMAAECSEEWSVEEEVEVEEVTQRTTETVVEEEVVVEEVAQLMTETITGPASEESLWTILAYEDRFATAQEEGPAAPPKLVESTSRKGTKQRQQRAKAKAVVSAPLPEAKAVVAETLPNPSVVEAKSASKADATMTLRNNVRAEPRKHRTKAQVVLAAKGPQSDFFDFEKPSRRFSTARFVWWHLLLVLCLFSGVMLALDTRMGASHVYKTKLSGAVKPGISHTWAAAKPVDRARARKDIAFFAKSMDVEFSKARAVASDLNAQVKDLRSTMKAVRQATKLAARNRKKHREAQRQQERQRQMWEASW